VCKLSGVHAVSLIMQDQPINDLKLTAADLFREARPDLRDQPDAPTTSEQPEQRPVKPVPQRPETGTRPANVLHVRVVTGAGGGPEKTILRSPRYRDPDRYHMAAAYLYPQGDPGMCVIRQNARQLDCPLYEIAEEHALDHHSVGALLELCRELKIDIWHGHDYKSNMLGLLIKRMHRMKLVSTAHGFTRETWRTRLYYHMDNLAMLGYDQVVAVSPQLIQHCARHGVNPDRLTYIPNAIDTTEYTRTRSTAQAKADLGLASDRFAIGVIGRLSPEKGVDRAIRMLPSLLASHPMAELHLIGDGPQRGQLEALAAQLGVSDAITWWGWQADARPIYEMLDALLLPSRTEGLPNVVLEAMAMRVPVAATDVGGVSDLLEDGADGIILGAHEQEWASQISPLLASPALLASYTERAYRRVHHAYNFRKRMTSVMAIYDRALGRHPSVTAAGESMAGQSRLAA
jgi:glycosyltransferase involved in cell wall biosynthesis